MPHEPTEELVYLMYLLMNWEEKYERKIWREYKISEKLGKILKSFIESQKEGELATAKQIKCIMKRIIHRAVF